MLILSHDFRGFKPSLQNISIVAGHIMVTDHEADMEPSKARLWSSVATEK